MADTAIETRIKEIKELARQGQVERAFADAQSLLSSARDNVDLLSLNAYILALHKNFDAALDLMTEAILICPSSEFHFMRARYYFYVGQYLSAEKDFSSSIALDKYGDASYLEELIFWQVESQIKLQKIEDALKNICKISSQKKTWTFALRSKLDLLNDCRNFQA